MGKVLSLILFDAFDFQLKFNLKYTNFIPKENHFLLMVYLQSV